MHYRFDDRVVVVTGAGHGLGRSYALEFARRGARVVVNDLGGGTAGGGASVAVAQAVVDEINAAGGEAVANGDSVEDGGRIIQTAMDAFGRVDVLINNAGILRDAAFGKMTEEDWELIYRVHLLGTFRTTRAAWTHMREARFGRVVVTASVAGIYGNFGQANYSAAKLGLFGFAQTLALEGAPRNILVNTIAPAAASRLTKGVLPPEVLDVLRPQYVTPLVVHLSRPESTETGKLFEVGGGWVSQTRWEQTQGVFFRDEFSVEDLADKWEEVTSFENSRHAARLTESKTGIEERLGRGLAFEPQAAG